MNRKAAVTINRPREVVERLWHSPDYRHDIADGKATVSFVDAPGDRGTEVHVALQVRGKVGRGVDAIAGSASLGHVKEQLRHFKQRVETGETSRSDSSAEGERVLRKLKQRPAQPLSPAELGKAGA